MKRILLKKITLCCCIVSLALIMVACGPKARVPVSPMDTPEHHSFTGLRLLDEAKYAEAGREFAAAIELAPNYSHAHTGLGLAKAYQGDLKGAAESIKSGWKYAATKEEKAFVHVSRIRLLTLAPGDRNWLQDAKREFDDATALIPGEGAAYYFMGSAYKVALEFDQAGVMFRKALDVNKEYVKEAGGEWKLVQKIQRAMPGTVAGKKIALLERINRADVAALLTEELRIDTLYKKRTMKTFDTSFKDPEGAKKSGEVPAQPKDIADHALRADIEGILGVGVRGLEMYIPTANFTRRIFWIGPPMR